MNREAFEAMLAMAAETAARVAPASPPPLANRVWVSRDSRLALASDAGLDTLVRAGAAGRRARLAWTLRPLLCRAIPLSAPADAGAVGNPAKQTIALLSASAGVAVKVSRGARAADMLRAEIAAVADEALQSRGLAPRLFASHTGSDEAWLAAEYCRLARFGDRAAYVAALRTDLMPRVFAAWAARAPERDTAAALVARVRAAAPAIPELAPAVARLEGLLAAGGDFAFPRVATHGDLQPRHMMIGGDDRLRLIDWDVAATRAWTADLLRLAMPEALHAAAWRDGEALLAPDFQPVFEDGLAWSAGVGGDRPGPDGRALLVLGALLERTIEIAVVRGIPYAGQPRAAPALKAMGLLS
jgi:hypothetical protein